MPLQRWPFYPVAESGKSCFVLGYRYVCAGVPEDPRDYVSYCRCHGHFRTEPLPVPSRAEARADVVREPTKAFGDRQSRR